LRNIAVALGNCPTSDEVVGALLARRQHPSELVREHVEWALQRHRQGRERAGNPGHSTAR
jgi:epoxyqueuosine reductase